ncbi:MAG: hypothetical protein JNK56_27325 [Myxococcales bacterium]|nr:hypothetical protein [Myxococcales bacterium]
MVKVEMMPREGETMFTQEHLDRLRMLACTPGAIERLLQCAERIPYIESSMSRVEGQCRTVTQRCDASDLMFQQYICPGNVNFSQRTLDEYSDDSQVNLEDIVTGLGGDFVNAFPVPPTKLIRVTHKSRPGYTPTKIAIDLNIAGGGNNYLDFTLQFYLVPGGVSTGLGLEVGPQMRGNQFLNKDGTQIHVPFPEYRNAPIDVGSLETLALVIKNNGAANNLDSAFVTIYYDNKLFYALCKKRCGCAPGAAPM